MAEARGTTRAGACGDKYEPGACDAAPVELCDDNECLEGYCVRYHTESGFPSCNDYDACVQVMLACTPGVCDPDCEAALCPAPYTCDPTAVNRFRCVKP